MRAALVTILSLGSLAGAHCASRASDTGPTSNASPAVEGGGAGDGGACGVRSGKRGKTTRTVMVDGKSRSYVAYLPESASATTALPFVYVFHGARQNGSELQYAW